jgi:septal ring factor EnvC (AmiA/AmiB activator)
LSPLSRYYLILQVLFIFIFHLAFSQQDRARLEEDKKKIEEEIKYTNQLLEQTRQTKKTSLNEVVMLNSKIGKRQSLINTINSEVRLIDGQISSSNDSIIQLTEELQKLKDDYAKMIYYAYKNQNRYDLLMFIFSAGDFNQAYQRLKYFQGYNAYRKKQAELITQTQWKIREKTLVLEERKEEKETLLTSIEREKNNLAREKTEKNTSVQKLSAREKELLKTLKEKENAAKKLQKAIQDIISEEIRLASDRAKKSGETASMNNVLPLTPAESVLSNDFTNNRGRLPWPLEHGIITEGFGEHQHPILDHVKVKNNGIDIMTTAGSEARAVFDGEVTRVMFVPSNNNVVIIRHGDYLTVYSNLDQVYVQRGEKITTKQKIGTVFTQPGDSKTELHFEIWQAKMLLNPQEWLAGGGQ